MDTRSRMCHGGWEVWVHGVYAIICICELIIGLWYHYMCVVEIICTYIYLSCTYAMCNTKQEYGFCSYNYRCLNLFKLLLYFTVILNQVKHSIIYLFNSTK